MRSNKERQVDECRIMAAGGHDHGNAYCILTPRKRKGTWEMISNVNKIHLVAAGSHDHGNACCILTPRKRKDTWEMISNVHKMKYMKHKKMPQ